MTLYQSPPGGRGGGVGRINVVASCNRNLGYPASLINWIGHRLKLFVNFERVGNHYCFVFQTVYLFQLKAIIN